MTNRGFILVYFVVPGVVLLANGLVFSSILSQALRRAYKRDTWRYVLAWGAGLSFPVWYGGMFYTLLGTLDSWGKVDPWVAYILPLLILVGSAVAAITIRLATGHWRATAGCAFGLVMFVLPVVWTMSEGSYVWLALFACSVILWHFFVRRSLLAWVPLALAARGRLCWSCDYDLSGLPTITLCPECSLWNGCSCRARRSCLRCGYDLIGLPAHAKCPECGV